MCSVHTKTMACWFHELHNLPYSYIEAVTFEILAVAVTSDWSSRCDTRTRATENESRTLESKSTRSAFLSHLLCRVKSTCKMIIPHP